MTIRPLLALADDIEAEDHYPSYVVKHVDVLRAADAVVKLHGRDIKGDCQTCGYPVADEGHEEDCPIGLFGNRC